MSLPTTGPMSLTAIGYEAKVPVFSKVDLNDIELRKLSNKLNDRSQLSFLDFRGKAYGVGPGYAPGNFVDVTGAGFGVPTTSNTIIVSNAAVDGQTMFLSAVNSASYQINGGSWVDKSVIGSLKAGDTLAIRLSAAASGFQALATATVQYGSNILTFNVTTGQESATTTWFIVDGTSGGGQDYRFYAPIGGGAPGGVYLGEFPAIGTTIPGRPDIWDGVSGYVDQRGYYRVRALDGDTPSFILTFDPNNQTLVKKASVYGIAPVYENTTITIADYQDPIQYGAYPQFKLYGRSDLKVDFGDDFTSITFHY